MFGYGNGMNGWGFALMIAATLVLIGLVVAGVLALTRAGGVARQPGAERPPQDLRPYPESGHGGKSEQ
jgi:putative membrane protein